MYKMELRNRDVVFYEFQISILFVYQLNVDFVYYENKWMEIYFVNGFVRVDYFMWMEYGYEISYMLVFYVFN